MGMTTISTIVFILSILSAIVTGGIKFLENSQKGQDWLDKVSTTESLKNSNEKISDTENN